MSDIEQETWIENVARELRRPVRFRLDFDRRVMAIVRHSADDLGTRRGWHVSITLTPLRAMAVAAGLATLAIGSGWVFSRELVRGTERVATAKAASFPGAATAARAVQFVVVAPDASEVTLVGDFNDWNSTATPMYLESSSGVWSVTVSLAAGRYQYAFVINGSEWRADPAAPAAPVNDFGTPNSIVAVTDRTS